MFTDNLNVCHIEGYVGIIKKMKTAYHGMSKALEFHVGVNKPIMRNGEKSNVVSFIPVVAYDNDATICQKYLTKGKEVRISGELKQIRSNSDNDEVTNRIVVILKEITFGRNPKENIKNISFN
jgi:single-stranded DNA-binding protein